MILRTIDPLLDDAEEREIHEKTIQHWLSELREVAYEAEDVLEEYDYQVIKTQVEGMTAKARYSLKGKQVDDGDDLYDDQVSLDSSTWIKIPILERIINKYDEIAKDREALKLKPEDAPRRLSLDDGMKRPPTSSLVHDADVFGREDDKKKIIQLLMSNTEEKNTVIPIVGMGGVGKTTLAQLVYNDPVVCEHFSPKEQMWEDVLNNNLWELEQTKDLILPALRISYNHMPGHLKPCFIYSSLFPKDHKFKKVELIRMWIAQGYIQLIGRKRFLEDIASEYFEDLQSRSFFQCSKSGKSFTLHDMVHDLARSISRTEICSFLDSDELKIPTDAKHIFIQHTKMPTTIEELEATIQDGIFEANSILFI